MPAITALSSHHLTDLLCFALDHVAVRGGLTCTFVGSDTPDLPVHEVVIGQLYASRLSCDCDDSDLSSTSHDTGIRSSGHCHCCYICPAEDGGYVLLTLPLPLPQLEHQLPSHHELPIIDLSPPPLVCGSSAPPTHNSNSSDIQHSTPDIGTNSSCSIRPENSGVSRSGSRHRPVFSPVEWSSAQTLSTQVTALQAYGMHVHVGGEVYTDMDEPGDLAQLLDRACLYLSEVESGQLLADDIAGACVQYIASPQEQSAENEDRGDPGRGGKEEKGEAIRFRFTSPPSHTLHALESIGDEKLNRLKSIIKIS